MYYQNMNGFSSKLRELLFAIDACRSQYDIFLFTETWLYEGIYADEFFDTSLFSVFRHDRIDVNKSRGGGVLIAAKRILGAVAVEIDVVVADKLQIDQLCVRVDATGCGFLIFLSYIPPKSSLFIYEKHLSNIDRVTSMPEYINYKICVIGDFNCGDIIWSSTNNHNFVPFSLPTDVDVLLIDSLFSNNLIQINNVANSLGRYLDLVFISEDLQSSVMENTPLLSNYVHHKSIDICFKNYNFDNFSKFNNNKSIFKFNSHNLSLMNNCFKNINWLNEFLDKNISEKFRCFKSLFNSVLNDCVPKHRSKVSSHPIWYNKRILNLKNAKNNAFKKYKQNPSNDSYAVFSRLRKEFVFLSKFLYSNYIHSVESNLKQSPTSFWKFINAKRNSTGFPATMCFESNNTSDPKMIVDYFGQFFESIYNSSTSATINYQYIKSLPSVFDCSSIFFDLNEVVDALVKIKPKKTADILGFFPIVFRHCASSLSVPLLHIFNESISNGIFLDEWKVSIIDPIFKSGSKNLVSNYRPITKLSVVPKLLDSLVQDKFKYVIKHQVSKYQHGFWKGRSTNSNLIEFTNFCINTLDNRKQVHKNLKLMGSMDRSYNGFHHIYLDGNNM
ncbi:uncharacterized protein LOC129916035 [Episyrphus balteatus]|uniref:uncharacterized protein LOC129912105 n=1 Tax=Episyrphus balteatus TaxID=286459 RepID=UPI002484E961|nr:uncharacterized protein LOC129912105 [Episyrphus balteatus]XP_055851648.1 uncharacterized protein LOC129915946 [Episyrphus balteatus]XP_055851772.1 uncharacterized protein LOC129916035 [Episyrphus balteatus]